MFGFFLVFSDLLEILLYRVFCSVSLVVKLFAGLITEPAIEELRKHSAWNTLGKE